MRKLITLMLVFLSTATFAQNQFELIPYCQNDTSQIYLQWYNASSGTANRWINESATVISPSGTVKPGYCGCSGPNYYIGQCIEISSINGTVIDTCSNDTIYVSGGGAQTLVLGAKDDTTQALGISGGNSVIIDVRDLDADSTNEIQTLLQINDSTYVLSIANDTVIIRSRGTSVVSPNYTIDTLNDSTTIVWNITNQNASYHLTLGGNRILPIPTGVLAGNYYTIAIQQDSVGSHELFYDSGYQWAFDDPFVVPPSPNSYSLITLYYNGIEFISYAIDTSQSSGGGGGGGSGAFEVVANVVKPATGVDMATDDLVFGSPTLDYNSISDNSGRMFYDKSKYAFRAGRAESTNWDDVNVGSYSVAFGNGSKAFGTYSFAAGFVSTASGQGAFAGGRSSATGIYSTSIGDLNTSAGSYSVALGRNCAAIGVQSFAIGSYCTSTGYYSGALGNRVTSYSFGEITLGVYNTAYTVAAGGITTFNPTDRIFTVGNGVSGATKDAFMILKNGKTGVGFSNFETTANPEILQVNGDVRAANYSGGFFKPVTSTDAAAPNNSVYYSSDAGKLVYKDSGGIINNLY